ncbi:MAG: bifunctional DNA primase/polymerase [Actinomycetia bacterium]|nr:bifunctional DNA primase/polymerase [Actinomycetes bacterium]
MSPPPQAPRGGLQETRQTADLQGLAEADGAADTRAGRGALGRGPHADLNVGISCHGLLVVDLDSADSSALRELYETQGGILPSPTVAKGGGGQHFYFQMPAGES